MKPEKLHSMEFGFDLSMLDSRLSLDFTYYKTNSKNQYFTVKAPLAGGYEQFYINTGDIQNSGFESSIGWRQDFSPDLNWKTDFNVSYNDNKVKELDRSKPICLNMIYGAALHINNTDRKTKV